MKKTMINLRARPIALILAGIATFLAIQSIVLRTIQYRLGDTNSYWLYQYGELANINREANIPTWYSAALLLGLALLLLIIPCPGAPWAVLARVGRSDLIFTYISMDEASTIHEKLTPILQEQLETGYFYFGWVVVGLCRRAGRRPGLLPFVSACATDSQPVYPRPSALCRRRAGHRVHRANLWFQRRLPAQFSPLVRWKGGWRC